MSTTVTKIIDPDSGAGTDYTSLAAWEAARQRDLTAADEIEIASCRCSSGSEDTGGAFAVDGWTTDSTRYIKITVQDAYRHAGVWSTAKYRCRFSNTTGDSLNVLEQYTIVEYLQAYYNASGSSWRGVFALKASYSQCQFCIAKGDGSDMTGGGYVGDPSNTNMLFYRNIIYDFTGTNSWGIATGDSINSTNHIGQNTVFGCTYGINYNNTPITSKQNYAGSCTLDFANKTGVTTSKNISSDATSPDGASYQGKNSYSNYFVDYANKDFHLKSTDTVLKDAGDNLGSPYDVDIDGQTVTGTWDIGADEWMAVLPVYLYHYMHH